MLASLTSATSSVRPKTSSIACIASTSRACILCSQAAVPVMVRQGGGVILNMASIVSFIGVADRFAYSMTKGAVLTMTKSVAIDYVKQHVRCNCICPARIRTPFVDGFVKKNYPGTRRGGAAGAFGVPADGPHGVAGRSRVPCACISARMRRRSSQGRRTRSTAEC